MTICPIFNCKADLSRLMGSHSMEFLSESRRVLALIFQKHSDHLVQHFCHSERCLQSKFEKNYLNIPMKNFMTMQTLEALNNRYKHCPNLFLLKNRVILDLLINFSQKVPIIGKLHNSASNKHNLSTIRIYFTHQKMPVYSLQCINY